ncbi:hypothetical protein OH807_18570 [Kitasatospora sp. NBC_01560]|uniref:hypothetical protein n=1 Tax=Kitasatospora sp. NBC_01560 TaxID=2975965 RepID=UPI003862DFB3
MGGRRLAAAVHIEHPVSHERLVLEPGTEPEAEVAVLITNPAAWEGGELPTFEEESGMESEGPEGPATVPVPEPEPEPEPELEPEVAGRSRKRSTAV